MTGVGLDGVSFADDNGVNPVKKSLVCVSHGEDEQLSSTPTVKFLCGAYHLTIVSVSAGAVGQPMTDKHA